MEVIFDPNRPPQNAAASGAIKDGDQTTFMQDVVQASNDVPVLVDFLPKAHLLRLQPKSHLILVGAPSVLFVMLLNALQSVSVRS